MVQGQTTTAHADSVCHKVVKRVAEEADVDPLELTPPLNEVIDSDALENIFANGRTIGKVIFNYNGYEVSVFPDGYVSVISHGTQPQSARGRRQIFNRSEACLERSSHSESDC